MENTIQPQAAETLDRESLYLASLILQDIHEIQREIHILVAVLLRYAEMGTSITESLIGWSMPTGSVEN